MQYKPVCKSSQNPHFIFNTEVPIKQSRENPGFSVFGSKDAALKIIYAFWYFQERPKLITEEKKERYSSKTSIRRFLTDNPLTTEAEGDAPPPLPLDKQVHIFSEKLKDPKIAERYFALCMAAENDAKVDYCDESINGFLAALDMEDLPGMLNDNSTPIAINTGVMRGMIHGEICSGKFLRRFISVKVKQKFELDNNIRNIHVRVTGVDNSIEIDKSLLPSLGIIADTLWLARVERGLSQRNAAICSGVSEGNIRFIEADKEGVREDTLLKLLAAYGRLDLYDNEPFMKTVIKLDEKNQPFSYAFAIHAYKKGFNRTKVAEKLGVSQPTLSRWITGTRLMSDKKAYDIATLLDWDWQDMQNRYQQQYNQKFSLSPAKAEIPLKKLAKDFQVTDVTMTKKLAHLQRALIEEIAQKKIMPQEEAKTFVSERLMGLRSSERSQGWYVSKEIERDLRKGKNHQTR